MAGIRAYAIVLLITFITNGVACRSKEAHYGNQSRPARVLIDGRSLLGCYEAQWPVARPFGYVSTPRQFRLSTDRLPWKGGHLLPETRRTV